MIPSFIQNEHALTKVLQRSELLMMLERSRKEGTFKLTDLDLSEIDSCWNISFEGYVLENVIFSRFKPESNSKKELFNLSFMGALLNGVSFA